MAPAVQGTPPRVAPNWKPNNTSRARGKQPFQGRPLRRRAIPNLNTESDKEGRKAWRENKRPEGHYDFPSGYDPNAHVGSFESFKFVEASTGAHISLRKRKNHADSNVYVADIWGTPDQTQQASNAIYDYITNSDARSNKTFTKVRSNRGAQYEANLHKKLQREQKRQKFCKKVSESEIAERKYAYSIAVPWSEENWRVEDALGQQLEALDEIRMDSFCYIHLSRQGHETNFVLLGDDHDKMVDAASRLRAIPARIISHSLPATQLFLFKPLPLPFDYNAFNVEQVDYARPPYFIDAQKLAADEGVAGKYLKLRPTGISEGQHLPDDFADVTSLDKIEDQGAIWMGAKHATTLNAQYLNLWIGHALKHLTVYRGHVQMEVNIGTCVFQRYKRALELEAEALEDILFEANRGYELESFMAANLGDYQCRVLLERFITCRPLLSFYDSPLPSHWTLQQCLDTCHPRLKAAFVIEQGLVDSLRLELEYKKNSLGEFDEISRRWLRLKGGGDAPADFLDINMLDLVDPHASYGLKISRCDVLNELREDKLRPVYHQFANKVHPITRNSAMLLKDKRLFDVPATGTSSEVKLRYYEQCRSWFFSIGSSGYFAELYTKSAVDVIPDNLTKPEGTPKPWPRQEQWGMRVWHDRWAGLFNENKELGIGKKTKWQPTEAQFFPSEDCLDYVDMEGTEAEVGAGFEALLRAMKTVEDVAMGGIEKREKR